MTADAAFRGGGENDQQHQQLMSGFIAKWRTGKIRKIILINLIYDDTFEKLLKTTFDSNSLSSSQGDVEWDMY